MNRTWAEIDIDALKHNFKNIRNITQKNAKVMSVVKADAYGHGVFECCRALEESGTDAFAVATVEEAKEIREYGFKLPILILGGISDNDILDIINYDIMPAVFDFDFAKKISDLAKQMNKTVKIHIKLDTGMSRIGFQTGEKSDETVNTVLEISKLPNVFIEGMFSHFSCADEENHDYTKMQFERFTRVYKALEEKGLNIPCKHIANSAAIMMFPEMHLDMVRAGIILYGYYPSNEVDKTRLELKPVMTVKSHITLIKNAEDGIGVSYGKEYITEGNTRIATIAVGYADGYLRSIAKSGSIEVKGQLCKIIGRICMDQCMIDVTNVNNIDVGDEVILFGRDKITADNIAAWMNTISYEVLCVVSKRVPRIYKKDGRID